MKIARKLKSLFFTGHKEPSTVYNGMAGGCTYLWQISITIKLNKKEFSNEKILLNALKKCFFSAELGGLSASLGCY